MASAALDAVSAFATTVARRPEDFVTKSDTLAASIRNHLKLFFDYAASRTSAAVVRSTPLPELYIDGFDTEQVWAELRIQHDAVLSGASRLLPSLERQLRAEESADDVPAQRSRSGGLISADSEAASDSGSGGDEEPSDVDDSDAGAESEAEEDAADAEAEDAVTDEEGEGDAFSVGSMERFVAEGETALARMRMRAGLAPPGAGSTSSSSDDDDEKEELDLNAPYVPFEDAEEEEQEASGQRLRAGKRAPSKAPDSKASRLAALLKKGPTAEDLYGPRPGSRRAREGGQSGAGDSSGEGDESEEGGDEEGGESDEEEEEEGSLASGGSGDRFIDDGLGVEGSSEEEEEGSTEEEDDSEPPRGRKKKGVSFADAEPDDDESADGEEEEADAGAPPEPLSRHLRAKAALAQEIAGLEGSLLGDRPWHLKGEVTAARRPANSLLEASVEYDQALKLAPAVTVEASVALEDLIRQRIADRAFDDPVRKAPPASSAAAAAAAARAAPDVSTEKSKAGLGDIYAEAYAEKAAAGGPTGAAAAALAEQEKKAKELMAALFVRLDALSNFHYTPRPPAHELSVKADLPAIALEEVVPLAVSDAALRAPEEVLARRTGRAGVLRSRGEMTAEQRAADRQARKSAAAKAKAARTAMQAVAAQSDPLLAARMAREAALKTIGRAKNVTFAPGMKGAKGGEEGRGKAAAGASAGSKRGRAEGAEGRGGESSGAAASAKFGGGGGGLGNSTAFFSQLQEEAQRKIRAIAYPDAAAAAAKGAGGGGAAGGRPGTSAAARLKL